MLKIGTTLYLEQMTEGKLEKYKTKIASIGERELTIELPIHVESKQFGYFDLGTLFQAHFIMEEKVYHFETELRQRFYERNIPLLVVSFPGNEHLRTIQNRKHLRVQAALDAAISPLHNEFRRFTTVTIDISGGGVSVHLPKGYSFTTNQEVGLWIVLPLSGNQYVYVKVKGLFVRQYEVGHYSRAIFKFYNIKDGDRQHIVRFTLQRDLYLRKLLKKEGITQ
ncbi:hypothetical protein GCM10011391_16760 [Pullulanibacillus camelliae]|uniref:Pilus assembly protein PilZ n=1 Tax=Pullulanibacillus camelliae TaxID=1707096 RepID=A0A8J2VXM2_9BACL|nr:flagellar brake domain-containing protein [Pullulanibacillus camelliae]GGE38580.1 hypothetical protein GCM10011391_16760 [Pullulanibacillus camelliae]